MLSVPLQESCFVSIKHKIVVFSFDVSFGLTWHMLIPCYDYKTSHLKPLWSFSFWLVISLYALINNVLSLCMIMAIIALLVGRIQSFASLHLYWVFYSCIQPPKTKFAKCVHHIYLFVVFHCHSIVVCLCATFKNFLSILFLLLMEISQMTIVLRSMLLVQYF